MKKTIALILALAMCFCLFSGCGKTEEPAPVAPATPAAPAENGDATPAPADYEYPEMTIVINDYNVATSGPALATQVACDYIEEKSGGKITCEVYYGGTLMEASDSFAGCSDGMCDITYYIYTLNSGVCTLSTLFTSYYFREMPGIMGMFEIINNTLESVPEFRQEFANQNLYQLSACPTTAAPIEFNDPTLASKIKTPDDMAGLLLQSSGYNTPAWANHGVSGMSMAPSEWYTNLERGVVDGLTMNIPGCNDFGLVDVTGSYLAFGDNRGGLYNSCAGYFANMDSWNSWDPEVQQLIKEGFYVGAKWNAEYDCERENAVWESEVAAGKNIVCIPTAEMQPWYDLGAETIELWKEDVRELGIDPDKLIEGYSAAVDEWFAANG